MDENKSSLEKLEETRDSIIIEEAKEVRKSGHDLERWTVASLLLANGGAVVALLRSEYTQEALFTDAGWYFVGGFLAALLAGFFHSIYAESFATNLLEGVWSEDVQDRSDYRKFRETAAGNATGSALITLGLMIVAFVAFVLGCLAVSDAPTRASQINQVEALEVNVTNNGA
ncbi:MAG TPA: hypothetical protein VK403_05300 [Allosphingosinicella sp.]|nr:hypothetical protein [Allosphingosinicella sp.]